MELARALLVIVVSYAAVGLLFAGIFVSSAGVTVVDHAARGSRWTFRVLILPGVAALWPIMLARWVRAGRPM